MSLDSSIDVLYNDALSKRRTRSIGSCPGQTETERHRDTEIQRERERDRETEGETGRQRESLIVG